MISLHWQFIGSQFSIAALSLLSWRRLIPSYIPLQKRVILSQNPPPLPPPPPSSNSLTKNAFCQSNLITFEWQNCWVFQFVVLLLAAEPKQLSSNAIRLMLTSAQVVQTSVFITENSPIQGFPQQSITYFFFYGVNKATKCKLTIRAIFLLCSFDTTIRLNR